MKNRAQKRLSKSLLIIAMISQPLMSFNRNPDILHDAFFFSQAKALNSGLRIHQDVYSPYGPLVPWIISFCMKVFGDYLIIGRVLGLLILLGICFFMYVILRHRMTVLGSLLSVSLFVSLSPERTEVTSPRWIYGAGIWPTSVTILLTLNLLWISLKIFQEQKSKFIDFQLLITSSFSTFLLVSRIQGILTLCVFLFALCFCLISGNLEVRRRAIVVIIGISISAILLLVYMWATHLLVPTMKEMIIAPFNVTSYGMNGRWISWIKSLVVSCTASILALSFSLLILMILMKKIDFYKTFAIFAPILLILFFASSRYEFPESLNGNPILWSMKVVTWLPSWTTWATALSCLYVIALALIRFIKLEVFSSNGLLPSPTVRLLMIPIGIASFSNLFYNYGYVYLLFPVTMIVLVFNLDGIPIASITKKVIEVWSIIQITIFMLVSVSGYLQESRKFSYDVFAGMRDSREYSKQLEEVVVFVESSNIHQTSQLFCDHAIYRYFDVSSYQTDKALMISPPQDRASYLSAISKLADEALVCGENNFFTPVELHASGWQETNRMQVDLEPSISVQLLTRNGGG